MRLDVVDSFEHAVPGGGLARAQRHHLRLRAMSPWLWTMALMALPVQALPGWRAQPAELFVLPLLLAAAWSWARGMRPAIGPLDWGVAVWTGAVVVAMLVSAAR